MNRRSYTGLMRFPAYGLYDHKGRLVATIRAESADAARSIFRRSFLRGERVRRLP
jgi:hypothetical protein